MQALVKVSTRLLCLQGQGLGTAMTSITRALVLQRVYVSIFILSETK
jgi:hypothetical protein